MAITALRMSPSCRKGGALRGEYLEPTERLARGPQPSSFTASSPKLWLHSLLFGFGFAPLTGRLGGVMAGQKLV